MTKLTIAGLLTSTMIASAALMVTGNTTEASCDECNKDWTALTVALNGAWGSAKDASRTAAMTQAIAQCRERAGSSSGCGSYTATVRDAWSVAYACGEENFIVTAKSLREVHFAAINQMIALRDFERVEHEDCRSIIAINPDGVPVIAEIPAAALPFIAPQHSEAMQD